MLYYSDCGRGGHTLFEKACTVTQDSLNYS